MSEMDKKASNLELLAQYTHILNQRTQEINQWVGKARINSPELLEESLEELCTTVEEMQIAEEELRLQNEQLRASQEERLAERQRYQDLFEFAPDAYLVTDVDGKILEANYAAAELFQLSQEFLIGKPLVLFVTQIGRRNFSIQLIRLQETDWLQNWEITLQQRNGQIFDAAINVKAVRDRDGKAIGLRWLVRDVTIRKRREERLRLLESVVVNANDAIIITEAQPIEEPGPRVLYVNEAFTRMTGYTSEEILGKTPRILQGENTDRTTLNKIHTALLDWQSIVVELINYRKDGSEFWVEMSIVPIANETGWYTHWIAVQRDITDRKQAEKQKIEIIREQVAREEAQAANRAKDEFIATVSHELRTPLQAVIGWTQILKRKLLDRTMMNRALETIEHNAKMQAKLIEELLDLSRIAQGKVDLKMTAISLCQVIEIAIDTLRPIIEAKEIQLNTYLDDRDVSILGDAERLRQVVSNLLTNAIKFTPDRGNIEVSLYYNDSHAQIIVKDNGKGISAEFLPYVFDRFRQADCQNSSAQTGLGLGLAIARQLVEMHGGTIHADSLGENQGATFTVLLPLNATPD
ncbi:MAG TPA: PAS domain S-box protein [Leptolyngbyaceae cyanobacterium]